MHDTIIAAFCISLTALGLSYLLQARAWATLYVEWEVHPDRLMPIGFLMLIAGLFLALEVNDWSGTWGIFITAFGWMMALEGALMTFRPSAVSGFTRLLGARLTRYFRLGGLLILGLGCLLCWEYLLRDFF